MPEGSKRINKDIVIQAKNVIQTSRFITGKLKSYRLDTR